MEHRDAVQQSFVEKYLLDELTPAIREEFEEHYFDCSECDIDLRATAAFLDAARKDLATPPAPTPAPIPEKRSFFAWFWNPAFLAPVLAACLAVIAYQNLSLFPHQHAQVAEVLPSIALAGGESRGGEMQSINVRPNSPFSLLVDIPAQDRFPTYTCLLYSPSDSQIWKLTVTAQQAKDTIVISVPPADWAAGVYTLVVKGNTTAKAGVDLERQPFQLNRQQ